MHTVTVHKCAPDGTLVLAYRAVFAEQLAHGVRLAARWERAPLELGYVTFETGDLFAEWFYDDRWYNVLRIHGVSDGTLKGWYCNVTYPAEIGDSTVTYRDLYLDVWVQPDGNTRVLDEDEFAAAHLDAETRSQALAGLADLLVAIRSSYGPFAER